MASESAMYCSTQSLEANESILGTATPTQTYLLIEFNGLWDPKAIPGSALPETVKAWLKAASDQIPDCKTLLIKQRPARDDGSIHFYIVQAYETNPNLYFFQAERYEDFLDIDILAALENDPRYQPNISDRKLALVCTHGRRDACCARVGTLAYGALREAAQNYPEAEIWQVSHVGGHRFAANMICLPHGILYGRVDPDNGSLILDAYLKDQVYPLNLRGRACYPKHVQAAEYYLRQQTGAQGVQAFRHISTNELSPDHWQVQFLESNTSTQHSIEIAIHTGDEWVYQDCKFEKKLPVKEFRFVSYQPGDIK